MTFCYLEHSTYNVPLNGNYHYHHDGGMDQAIKRTKRPKRPERPIDEDNGKFISRPQTVAPIVKCTHDELGLVLVSKAKTININIQLLRTIIMITVQLAGPSRADRAYISLPSVILMAGPM